jgi:hypothetical protein
MSKYNRNKGWGFGTTTPVGRTARHKKAREGKK